MTTTYFYFDPHSFMRDDSGRGQFPVKHDGASPYRRDLSYERTAGNLKKRNANTVSLKPVSSTPRERVLGRLDYIARCNATDNWDGDGAVGVKEGAVELVRDFIRLLPNSCLPDPDEIKADVDGEITLDWHKANNRTFVVSVDETGRIAYSGLFEDGGSCCGDERIVDNKISETIMACIRRAL